MFIGFVSILCVQVTGVHLSHRESYVLCVVMLRVYRPLCFRVSKWMDCHMKMDEEQNFERVQDPIHNQAKTILTH